MSPAAKETRTHALSPHEVFSFCSHFPQCRLIATFSVFICVHEERHAFLQNSHFADILSVLRFAFSFFYLPFQIATRENTSHTSETKVCVHRRLTCAVICRPTRFLVFFFFADVSALLQTSSSASELSKWRRCHIPRHSR